MRLPNPLLFPELLEMLSKGDIKTLSDFCENSHPAIVADMLLPLPHDKTFSIIMTAKPEVRAEIFSHLDDDYQKELVLVSPKKEIAYILNLLPHDDRADLFKALPENVQDEILPALAQAERDDIRRLASFSEKTAGAVMTSDYATLPIELNSQQAIEHLRKVAPDSETIYYSYVVDEKRRLLGLVSLKDLILAPRDKKITEIMHKEIIRVNVNDDQEDSAQKIQKYDLLALPVVDDNDVLVGIITQDDAFDILTEEHTEDIEKLMAISGSHSTSYLKTSSFSHFKNRAGWVVSLAIIGLGSGMIIHSFEGTLSKLMLLALYMPMIADAGGNTGSQSSTVIIRAIALKEVTFPDLFKILFKEFKVAVMLSLVLGLLAFLKVTFLSGNSVIPSGFSLLKISACISIALSLQVISATLIGALLPMAAQKLRLDPAVVASPALTTCVDVTGLLIYFYTAKFMLGL
jgi:magnesium transporter